MTSKFYNLLKLEFYNITEVYFTSVLLNKISSRINPYPSPE